MVSVRAAGKGAVARIEGVADRSAAEALRGSLVEVDRSALPALRDGEYYHSDLIGLRRRTRAGKAIGTVVAVENFGAGDLLEIETAGRQAVADPVSDGIADLKDGAVVLDPEFLA